MKDFLLRVRVCGQNLKNENSRRCLANYTSENWIKKRSARAARSFFHVQRIKSLICDVVVAVAVVIS